MDLTKTRETAKPQRKSEAEKYGTNKRSEPVFAEIVRNRSGISSGEIDFSAKSIEDLTESDQQEAINCAYLVYLKWCKELGKTTTIKERK